MSKNPAVLHSPFSPYILETQAEANLVLALNEAVDGTLGSVDLTQKADWSGNLVGKVSHELQIMIPDEDLRGYVTDTIRGLGVEYLEHVVRMQAAHKWVDLNGDSKPCPQGVRVVSAWSVGQYKYEYNPCHHHFGDISGVIYTKIPPFYHEELNREQIDHAPANGHIEFFFGERDNFRIQSIKFRPELGKVFLFPSSLRHFVYPFYSDGERRSVSFNLEIMNV